MKIAIHLKTGNEYYILFESVINTTNEQNGQQMIVYQNAANQIYTREKEEFYKKFRLKEYTQMTSVELLKATLLKKGFDGLYMAGEQCGCDLEHLNCCGEYSGECFPGYKHPARNGNEDYFISRENKQL